MGTNDFKHGLNKLQCPKCKNNNLDLKINGHIDFFDSNGEISCPNCNEVYAIIDGIIVMVPREKLGQLNSNNWDFIYTRGIKGDFTRGIDKLAKTLENVLKNKKNLFTQYPLIELASKLRIIETGSFLEIGCGTGAFSLLLKKFGEIKNPPYLVDISVPALKTAKKIFEKFNESAYFILADARNLPFNDKSFNLGFSTGLIEHFESEDRQKIISDQCRVSSDVICQFPTNSLFYWLQRSVITVINGKWPFGYERPLSYCEIKTLLEKENFEIKEIAYHDILTAIMYKFFYEYNWTKSLLFNKTIMNKFFRLDIVLHAAPSKGRSN